MTNKKNKYLLDSLSIQGTTTEIEVPQEIIDYYESVGMPLEFVKQCYYERAAFMRECKNIYDEITLKDFRPYVLRQMLLALKDYKMTAEEKRAQAISFAYGNCKLSNENITKEQVERAYDQLHADDDFVGKD